MRVEYLNESVAEEWHRMVAAEAAREAAEAEVAQGEAGSNGSSGGSSGNGSSGSEQAQRTAVLAHGEAEASHASSAVSSTSSIDAVYSPGAAISGTATGGPGSIPLAAEQHVLEVTATGAAISLALLLQQRAAGDDASSGSDSEDEDAASDQQRQGGGGGGAWLGDLPNEEARAHSSAALSALAYLEPCAHGEGRAGVVVGNLALPCCSCCCRPCCLHSSAVAAASACPSPRPWTASRISSPIAGLDELIVFDAVRRKFGIAPQVEGRITRAPGGAAGK